MSRRMVAGLAVGLLGVLSLVTGGRAEAQPAPIAVTGTITDASGRAVAGVLVTLSGAATATTTTDASGGYGFTDLPAGGTFTVAPAHPGLRFTPGSRTFPTAATSQTADFTAAPLFTLAGQVADLNGTGLPGVELALGGGVTATAVTDAAGRYAFRELPGGASYTVTPAATGFTFAPAARSVAALSADDTTADFSATGAAVGAFRRYFAEGATGSFFDTEIALLNPTRQPARVRLTFQRGDGVVVPHELTLPPTTRATVNPELLPGLAGADLATVVESDGPIVADRTMRWDASGYGSHAETSLAQPQTVWYFAEGATTGDFSLFYLLQNPSATPAQVEIRYLRPAPLAPIVKTYTVGATSRRTIFVNDEDPALGEAEISAVVTATNGVPIIAERAMYTHAGGRIFGAGHESAGIAAPATQWFLAEGATGSFFHLFILVGNPNGVAAELEFRYLLADGRVITRRRTAAANSRLTVGVHTEDPALASAAVSTIVTATNGVPVLVERAMWWPATGGWHEGHNSAGAVQTGTRWAMADGLVGGPAAAQTFILLANTGATAAAVRVTLVFEDGTTTARTFAVAATSRFNVQVGVEFPQARDRRFGAIVESLGAPPAPLVVERAIYHDAQGVVFAAGSNALATRLQDDTGPVGLPPSLGTAADASRAASQAVTATSGGTVTATAADGTTYRFQIPPGALVDDVTITMTPLAGVAGLPAGSRFVAGVQFGPDGLQLFKPAVLTITLPAGVDSSQIVGISYRGNGVELAPALTVATGQTVTVFITHFSGLLTVADPGNILHSFWDRRSPVGNQFANRVVLSTTTDAMIGVLRDWYNTVVAARLTGAAASDARLNDALTEYVFWRYAVELFGGALNLDQAPRILVELAPELRQSAGLAAAALQQGINRANARCVISHSLAEANAALRWQAIAAALEIAGPGSPLELDTVLLTLCVEVRYEDTRFPPNPRPGDDAELRIQAGFAFEDDGVVRHQPLHVLVEGVDGIVLADILRAATTDAQGIFTDTFGIDADAVNDGVRLDVTTCLAAPSSGSHLRKVCQQAFIVRGLTVEPSAATMAPGGTLQFGASMLGSPTTAVEWSTSSTGSTISPSGLFTAGQTLGTFAVTAVSTANRALRASATVTIQPAVVLLNARQSCLTALMPSPNPNVVVCNENPTTDFGPFETCFGVAPDGSPCPQQGPFFSASVQSAVSVQGRVLSGVSGRGSSSLEAGGRFGASRTTVFFEVRSRVRLDLSGTAACPQAPSQVLFQLGGSVRIDGCLQPFSHSVVLSPGTYSFDIAAGAGDGLATEPLVAPASASYEFLVTFTPVP